MTFLLLTNKLFALIVLLPTICNSGIIKCIGEQKCKDENKICLNDEACFIACNGTTNGQQACQKAEIDGTLATAVTLDCVYKQDCQDAKLICGTGICSIHCHGNNADNEQCKSITLECGVAPCKIYCHAPNSCHDSDFALSSTVSFECIGYCPSSFPSPFVRATSAPTIFPTTNPTKYPTTNPSKTPTIVNTTKYATLLITSSIKNEVEIIENKKDFLDNIPLVAIFSLILLILICMAFICIFYVRKMRHLKKKQKRNSVKNMNVEDNKQKYNNIPMQLGKDGASRNDEEIVKAESISDANSFDNCKGCTAIQMGENSSLMKENECIVNVEADSDKSKKSVDCIKTPSNSFSNGNMIDVELNGDEFVIHGETEGK